jgi:hypothetical protein
MINRIHGKWEQDKLRFHYSNWEQITKLPSIIGDWSLSQWESGGYLCKVPKIQKKTKKPAHRLKNFTTCPLRRISEIVSWESSKAWKTVMAPAWSSLFVPRTSAQILVNRRCTKSDFYVQLSERLTDSTSNICGWSQTVPRESCRKTKIASQNSTCA